MFEWSKNKKTKKNFMLAITSPLNICRERVLSLLHSLVFSSNVKHMITFLLRAFIDEREWICVIVAMSHLEYTWSFKNNLSSCCFFFLENIKLYPMVFPCVARILLIYCGNKDCPHLCDIVVYLGICTLTKRKKEKFRK